MTVGTVTGLGVHRRPDVVALASARAPGERFHGFGEQFAPFDLAGRRVPIVVREQGIGRGRQPLTAMVDLVSGQGGAWDTTYAPMPFYVTSENRGFALSGGRYSVFDLSQPGLTVVQAWAPEMDADLYTGRDPAQLLAAHTAATGTMASLPAWTRDGAVLGLQGGTVEVRRIVDEMLAASTKISAVWLQDWTGWRTTSFGDRLWWTWQLDQTHYPGWDDLVNDLHQRGIKVLTYVNPFLVDPSRGVPATCSPRPAPTATWSPIRRSPLPPGPGRVLGRHGRLHEPVSPRLVRPAHRHRGRRCRRGRLDGRLRRGLPFDAALHSGSPPTCTTDGQWNGPR